MPASYTPGWSAGAVAFMERRGAASHAWALRPHLRPGLRLLDVGCGPGSITVDLARAVAPGLVVAIDRQPGQAALTRERAARAGLANVVAYAADAAALPVAGGAADAAFAHALLEHVDDPVAVLREMRRAVRPGGVVVAVSPDWGGFLLAPPDDGAQRALERYAAIQEAGGGDTRAGRRLGGWMADAGLEGIARAARYECHDDPRPIADYLAARIEPGAAEEARALRDWARRDGALFAQAWLSATGRAPVRRPPEPNDDRSGPRP